MEFYSQINQRKLITLYSNDEDQVAKLKKDTLYKWKVSEPRNVKFHKKFFALLNLGFNNQDVYSSFDDYRELMIMRAGYFKTIPTAKGEIYRPLSVSFGSMDNQKFQELFDAVLIVIQRDLHSAKKEILAELYSFM